MYSSAAASVCNSHTFSDEKKKKKHQDFAQFSHLGNKELVCFALVFQLMAKISSFWVSLFLKDSFSLTSET